jgi:hypothetical protein
MLETDWKTSSAKTLLLTALSCLLIGRAWQHLLWDAPFRTLLWNQEWLAPIIETMTNISWHEYVTSSLTDQIIQYLIKLNGVFYLIGLFVCWKINSKSKWIKSYLILASISLCFLALLKTIEKFFFFGMFLEHMIQFSTPLIVYFFLFKTRLFVKYKMILKVIMACTFIGHGLFAIGYYPVPGHFIDMIVNVFGTNEGFARQLLKVAGALDILASILLFVPSLTRSMLCFMTLWGGATALARLIAHVDFNLISFTGNQWVWEALVRVPHALIPCFALYLFPKYKKDIKKPA